MHLAQFVSDPKPRVPSSLAGRGLLPPEVRQHGAGLAAAAGPGGQRPGVLRALLQLRAGHGLRERLHVPRTSALVVAMRARGGFGLVGGSWEPGRHGPVGLFFSRTRWVPGFVFGKPM